MHFERINLVTLLKSNVRAARMQIKQMLSLKR